MVAVLIPAVALVAVIMAVFLVVGYTIVFSRQGQGWGRRVPVYLGSPGISLLGGVIQFIRINAVIAESFFVWAQRVVAVAFHWAVGEVIDKRLRVFWFYWAVLLDQVNLIILPFVHNADLTIRALQHYTFDEL